MAWEGILAAWIASGPRRAQLGDSIRRMSGEMVERREGLVSGALVFRGTRVPVSVLFEYLEGGYSLEDFLREFPGVRREQAVAVLEDARERLGAAATTD